MNQMVSVKNASHFLGVSPSTFKRICDKYEIPLQRTMGGHRRIDRADLDRAYKLLWNGSQKKSLGTSATDAEGTQGIIERLLDRDVEGITDAICGHLESVDQLALVLENTLIPALWRIGELWRTREMEIYQEHICTNTVGTVLDLLLCRMPGVDADSSLAIGGTFESNLDSIASKLTCLVLRSIGMRSIDLGCNLPAVSIGKAASDLQPSVVWICHTHIENPGSMVENHRLLRQSLADSVKVLIGGGGLSPAMRRSLPDCMYFESMSMMAEAMSAGPIRV